MIRRIVVLFIVLVGTIPVTPSEAQTDAAISAEVIALERAALDVCMKGDGAAYEALLAPDVTVFDPRLATRLDGREAVLGFLQKIRPRTAIPGFEMIDPLVQRAGDGAVLTFVFVSYDEQRMPTSRWNFTEVYRRAAGRWQIVHTHASFTGGTPPAFCASVRLKP